jgi:hypothetical protein
MRNAPVLHGYEFLFDDFSLTRVLRGVLVGLLFLPIIFAALSLNTKTSQKTIQTTPAIESHLADRP